MEDADRIAFFIGLHSALEESVGEYAVVKYERTFLTIRQKPYTYDTKRDKALHKDYHKKGQLIESDLVLELFFRESLLSLHGGKDSFSRRPEIKQWSIADPNFHEDQISAAILHTFNEYIKHRYDVPF